MEFQRHLLQYQKLVSRKYNQKFCWERKGNRISVQIISERFENNIHRNKREPRPSESEIVKKTFYFFKRD